ncbi:hypothetical protein EUTSA_v10022996mg [Eutrema salsugineum]|uniref:RBR-type E3 ubiquitin transferase n=1 Tax=Eutrema salsugineum TaxID=72664 RepID=V4M3X7_EUTSA|nr:hypothetical protein EUTSA_v10022996mg [Eutrema salsugineum]
MDDYLSDEEEDYYYSSDQESLDGLDNEESNLHPVSSRGNTAKVITKESLMAAQREDLRRVMKLLSLKEHHARTLLIHYRWDVEKLFAVLVEKGKDSLFYGAGLTVLEDQRCNSSFSHSSMMSCDICIEDEPGYQMTRMDCGHCFCNNCWAGHFAVKINEGQSKRIRCMAHKCNAICDEDVVRTLVSKSQPDLAEKFDRFLIESYIEDNKMVKWCPSTPHCGNAIRVEDDELCELWRKKCHDESETVNWITIHTKSCPKCFKPVEKNGGCNLVTCLCGQSFCKEKQMERAKRDLFRYMYYHNRYKAHVDSSKLEDKLSDTILEKLKDFSWVTNGLHRLFRSRRVLSYSYPFAFYMFGDELFKDEMSSEEYECIENDLLGSLQLGIHNIAPYRSNGIERASDFYSSRNSKEVVGEISQPSNCGTSGWNSEDTSCSSRKRPRIYGSFRNNQTTLLDLNLPEEVIERK